MSAALVALAILLAFAGVWQLLGDRSEFAGATMGRAAARLTEGRVRSVAEALLALGLADRLERAGMAGRLGPGAIVAAKAGGCLAGVGCAALAAPVLPGRLGLPLVPFMAIAGFLAPDAWLERSARLRRAGVVASLPEALDILAVGAAAGRPPAVVIQELAAQGDGALAAELGLTVADIQSGASQHAAVEGLRRRVGGSEIAALSTALERSRRYGSPLAEQLESQASALRAEAGRRTEEAASRAAPKIQLVVALVLVPSVLLMIAAAIVAHSDALLGSL